MISGLLFGLNAVLNLAVTLVLARMLSASAYGAFATWTAASLFVATAVFDWVRFSAMRFYTPRSRAQDPTIRATLDLSFACCVPLAAICLAPAAALGWLPGLDVVTAIALVAFAVGNASNEYLAALARNLEQGGTYARLIVLRHSFTLGIGVSVAAFTKDPNATMVAMGLLVWPSVLYGAFKLKDAWINPASVMRPHTKMFMAYGVPLIAAEAVFQGISLLNRSWLAADTGLAAAGIYALTFDLAFKVVAVVASVGEAALMPRLVFRIGHQNRRDRGLHLELARVVGLMLLLTVPAGVGFWVLGRPFAALILAPEFQSGFIEGLGMALACAGLYVLQTYVLRPAFQVGLRTVPMLQSALLALVLDVITLAALRSQGLQGVMTAHLVGLGAGALFLLVRCFGENRVEWPVLATVKIAGAAALMAIAGRWAAASMTAPLLSLSAAGLTMTATFAASVLVLNPVGVRQMVRWPGRPRRSDHAVASSAPERTAPT